MSGTTSATGGFISGAVHYSADEIQAALQQMAAKVSGLPGNLMRPRWQVTPPVQPDAATDWGAIGVTRTEADEYVFIKHVDTPEPGYSVLQRHITLTILVTFYGPNAENYAGALRDGLYIPQNYEPLLPIGLKLRTVRDLSRIPEYFNQQWINRVDIAIELRMQQDRIYPILNLEGADISLITAEGVDNFVQVRPAS